MASLGRILALQCILCLLLVDIADYACAQTLACVESTEQPVVNNIDPPSGTTGTESTLSTYYTVTGERLDQVANFMVEYQDSIGVTRTLQLADSRFEQNETSISFHFTFPMPGTLPRIEGGVLTSITLVPNNTQCSSVTLEIALHETIVLILLVGPDAQPGTTIATLRGTCLPSLCGDNSTSYDIIVGETPLDQIRASSGELVARFPETIATGAQNTFISTQYQTFKLPVSNNFRLFESTTTALVSPNQGQKGTRIVITGDNLLGHGAVVEVTQVTLGSNVADVITASQERIELRASSGEPGTTSISINTTQQFSGLGSFDGPYTYLEDLWTQLEDGVISDIVPPAVQQGGTVTLCGSRLLGGGVSISNITLAGFSSTNFSQTPSPPNSSLAGDECVTVLVPTIAEQQVAGTVSIISNTEATVESVSNFTFAEIVAVTPSRGQPGTIVTITGVALLSGFSTSTPTVTLSGVEADLISASSTEVVVRATEPPDPVVSSGGMVIIPDVFGLLGAIDIAVSSPFSLSFSVTSMTPGWTYEPSGQIDSVSPPFGQIGTVLTVTGSNLLSYGNSLTHATVGSQNATIVQMTDIEVTLRAPNVRDVGMVDIILFSENGAQVRGENVFEFRERGMIESVTPTNGQRGTFVTISGSNLFGHGNNVVSVSFGAVPATILQSNTTTINVRVQPNTNIIDTPVSITLTADTSAIVESSVAIWTYLVQGVVSNINPSTGQEGTSVTITGTNLLGGGTSADRVLIDGVEGVIESQTSTSIVVIMGSIDTQINSTSPGQAFIMSNTGATVFGGAYIHQESGSIDNFSPTSGRRGTMITVSGRDLLGFGMSITMVMIAGNVGTLVSSSDTQVTIRAGVGAENAVGPIRFVINTGAMITSNTNFTYVQPGSVLDVVPSQGAEGSGVLIRGSALLPDNTQLSSITVGGIPVSRVVTATTSEVSVIVGPAPSINPLMAEIIITASDGSFIDDVFFEFLSLVLSLPTRTSGREGTLLAITLPSSNQFDPSGSLIATVDNEEAEMVSLDSPGTITVRVPRARRPGSFTVDVAVENTDHLVARLRDGFTYVPEGAIYSVTPDNGQRGTMITLQGENLLGGGVTISMATVAGATAMVGSSSDEMVQLVLMENSQSPPTQGEIILTADTGAITRRLNGFTVIQSGVITTVSPSSGQLGTRVTITGSGLTQGGLEIQMITLAGVQAGVMGDATDSVITVEAAQSPSMQPGPVEITLTSGAVITSDISVLFEYLEPGQIDMLMPNIGTVGTRVLITGSNILGGGESIVQVLLAGVGANISSFTDDNVTVIAQEGQPEFGDVEIVSNTGARILQENFWTYEQLGSVNSVDPPVGQQGIEVTIRGASLLGSSGTTIQECRLAGIVGRVMPSSVRNNEVVCIAGFFPDLASQPEVGTGPIQIMTNTGVVITSDNVTTFTYYLAEIERIEPSIGNNGTIVQISGINLFGFPGEGSTIDSVMLGNVPANVITSSDNDITVRVRSSPTSSNNVVRVTSSVGSFLELQNAWSYTALGLIESIIPDTAFSGETVLITGSNLLPPGLSDVTVILGQTMSAQAQIINSSAIEFVTGVYQSTDDAGEPLPVQLVYNTGETVFNPSVTFTYNATPGVVLSVTPSAGGEGAVVNITGTNLLNGQNISQVYLAGVAVTVIQENATEEEIIVTAGAGPVDGSFGSVVIETVDGRQSGLAGDAWRYYPIVANVFPSSGQNGTAVTIDLSRFDPLPTIESVNLTGISSSQFSVETNQQLTVIAELADSNTVGDVVVTFNDSSSLVIRDSWIYLAPVEVNNVSPGMQGYFNTTVTLIGQNFQAGGVTVTAVYLAGVQTTVGPQTNTQVEVQITEQRNSSSQSFVGPIVIESSQGATYTSLSNFTYVQVRVDSVEPQQGQRGTRVNITGIGLLLGGTSLSTVFLGDVEGMRGSMSDSEIIVSAAPFPFQTNVSDIIYIVDTGAEITISESWQYVVPGEITSVSPEEGSMGTIVTIMGVNLFGGGDRADTVLLNNVPAESIITNFDNIVQVVAGQSASALTPGNVQVISNTGAVTESSSTVDYTYLTPGNVMSASPQQGQNGTRIVIDGSFLHNGEGVRQVLLAGVETVIESISENTLTAGLPGTFIVRAGRPSILHSFSGPVTIVSNFNSMSVSSFNFTYLSEGVIFSVTPSRGQAGTMLVIEGENLLGGGSNLDNVYLAGVEVGMIGMATDTRVEVTAGSSTDELLGDIVLVSDTQAYVRRVDGWTYIQQGSVTDIQPSQGQQGTRITITGERLLSGGDRVSSGFLDDVGLEIASSTEVRVEARVMQPSSSFGFNPSSITLTSNFGGVLTQNFQWTFLNQSTIDTISPMNGTGNTLITIFGTNLLGGGTSIVSAITESIDATPLSWNDTVVVIRAGFNTNGQQRMGDIVLESDTGALTTAINAWMYDNECPEGQYGNTGNCLPCDEQCKSCFGPNSTDCYVCENFAVMLDNSSSAMECVPSCVSVSSLDRVCLDVCERSQYPMINSTANATFCQPCNSLCSPTLGCSGPDATQCGGCRDFLNTLTQTCIENCTTGMYADELNNCVPCDNQCVTAEGCFGADAFHCNQCANMFITTTLMESGEILDLCLERCPSLYYQEPDSSLCSPCASECSQGCTSSSPFDCVSCANVSLVYSNGTIRCLSTCNPDPTNINSYEDSTRVCQSCSSRCSLSGGCFGPTAFDCNGCRILPDTTIPIPSFNGECVNTCPNVNSTYSFYADNSTNQCEACDRTCTNGCRGPLSQDCIVVDVNPLAAEGGAIAIFIIVLFILIAILVALVVYIVVQKKRGDSYVVKKSDNNVELGERYATNNVRESNLSSPTDGGEENTGVTNANDDVLYFEAGPDGHDESVRSGPMVFANELYQDVPGEEAKKSIGETGSQDLLYTSMDGEPDQPYARPTPRSERKKETSTADIAAPSRPAPYKKENESKPPPPRPPSPDPDMDGEMYTDMEMSIKEVRVNPAVVDEEYSEMSPGPLVADEVYDDAESVTPMAPAVRSPAPPPPKQEEQPLLEDDGLYEDTESAAAQVAEYRRVSRQEQESPYKRLSGVVDKPPDLPSRPVPKKRPSVPLPETPLQKSLSNTSFSSTTSPTHPIMSQPIPEDMYIEAGPIEESLYEELPTGGDDRVQPASQPATRNEERRFISSPPAPPTARNEIPLPPKPKK